MTGTPDLHEDRGFMALFCLITSVMGIVFLANALSYEHIVDQVFASFPALLLLGTSIYIHILVARTAGVLPESVNTFIDTYIWEPPEQ